jgi:hypothetical protein
MLIATEGGGAERDDAAMLLGTTAKGPSAAMLHSDEGVAQRTESAVGSRVDDQPRRQSTRLSRTYTGAETTGTAIEIRDTATLATIHHHAGALLTSGNRTITADLPLVANLVNGWHNLGQTSASRILDDIRRKPGWNLGRKAEILERFAADSVPLLHKTMNLLELKEEICTILEEWTKESPPLSPKMLQFPECWPLDDIAPSTAPGGQEIFFYKRMGNAPPMRPCVGQDRLPGAYASGPPTLLSPFRPHHRVAVVVEPWDGQDPPADST